MTPIANDCARCLSHHDCPKANTCRRTTKPRGDAYRVVYAEFPTGENFHGYMPEKSE